MPPVVRHNTEGAALAVDVISHTVHLAQANFKIEYRQRQGQTQGPPPAGLGRTSLNGEP